jgi:hypothetical protein
MRFRFIEDRRADYSVTIMCDLLGVSPAGYYAWRARPESPRAGANRELVDNIKRVHRDTDGLSITSIMQHVSKPDMISLLTSRAFMIERGVISAIGYLSPIEMELKAA